MSCLIVDHNSVVLLHCIRYCPLLLHIARGCALYFKRKVGDLCACSCWIYIYPRG